MIFSGTNSVEETPDPLEDSGLAVWPTLKPSRKMSDKCYDDEYKDASIQNIPYIVFLETPRGPCTGAILDKNWIITAYTCVNRVRPVEYKIRGGTDIHEKGGSVHTIGKIISHERFGIPQRKILRNNLALVKVKEPFVFDDKHFPVKLAKIDEKLDVGTMLTVTGIRNDVETLQSASLPVYDLDWCRATFVGGEPEKSHAHYYGDLCLAHNKTKKCPCEVRPGDVLTNEGRLVGLMNYRPTCNDKEWHPALFVDITHYLDWIEKNMKL